MTIATASAPPESLRAETAIADRDWPVLANAVRADVAIVGCGVTGRTEAPVR